MNVLIRVEMQGIRLEAFETDVHKRWLIERGIEIISEASRRLPDELKAWHLDSCGAARSRSQQLWAMESKVKQLLSRVAA
jgi:hypothetical protein